MSLLKKKGKKDNGVQISTKDDIADYSYSYEYSDEVPLPVQPLLEKPSKQRFLRKKEKPLPKAKPKKTQKQMQALEKARETRARNATMKKDTENKLYAVRLEKEHKRLEKNVNNKVNRQMKADHMTRRKQEIAEAELSEYSDEGYQPVPKKRQIRQPKPKPQPRARAPLERELSPFTTTNLMTTLPRSSHGSKWFSGLLLNGGLTSRARDSNFFKVLVIS
jgi:hypothetical protein